MLSDQNRCIYRKNQIAEVICQLRFPEILAIEATPPAQFQDAIRSRFPVFSRRQEPGHPSGGSGAPTIINYQFASADGIWRINLTASFISLSCSRYVRWEEFAQQLDLPLTAFLRIYHPEQFDRIGLRYVNFISRSALGLDAVPFAKLIAPCYLGPLAVEGVSETATVRCSVDFDTALKGGCRVKYHAGPGMVKVHGVPDNEVKFVLDQDLYMPGKIPVNLSAGALHTLHGQAYPLFRAAISDRLHDAMQPI